MLSLFWKILYFNILLIYVIVYVEMCRTFLKLDWQLHMNLNKYSSVIFSKTRWENAIMQTSSRVSFIYRNYIFSRTHAEREERWGRNLSKYFGHCRREIRKHHQCMYYTILLNKRSMFDRLILIQLVRSYFI